VVDRGIDADAAPPGVGAVVVAAFAVKVTIVAFRHEDAPSPVTGSGS